MLVPILLTVITVLVVTIAIFATRWWKRWVEPGTETIRYAKLGAPRYKDIPKGPWPLSTARKKMKELWRIHHKVFRDNDDPTLYTPNPAKATFNPHKTP